VRVLVDSHTFLWTLLDDPRLSKKARQVMTAEDNELVFSLASLWEISIKMKLGRLKTVGSSVAYIREEMDAFGMELLPVRYEHVLRQEALPHHHGDPFDRMLIAQAAVEKLPILTRDERFRLYEVKLVW
jgi:PIN domain nuclease of toxin-antitoxin system